MLSVTHLEHAVLTMKAKMTLGGLQKAGGKEMWECAPKAESELGLLQGTRYEVVRFLRVLWDLVLLLEGRVANARDVVEKGIFTHEGVAPLNLSNLKS